jgi:stage II sporulation protein D
LFSRVRYIPGSIMRTAVRIPVRFVRVPTRFTRIVALLLQFSVAACGHKSRVSPPVVSQIPRPPAASAPPPAPSPVEAIASAPEGPGPAIRIGLTTTAREVRISAAAGDFQVVEKIAEASRQTVRGELQVRLEQQAEEQREIFRVQVAALGSREAAEDMGRKLATQFSVPAVTRDHLATGTIQVRLGEFSGREEAQAFASGPLAAAGYAKSFVVRESGPRGVGEARLAIRGPENFFRVNRTGYLFFPSSSATFLRLDGKSYRGVLDISLNKSGQITVVNQLGLEEYLYGVVPAEISPTIYPELAALAAQAIAARTYALKNMGRFSADGFDLTSDIRTQVYGGASIEKDATNAAVQRTYAMAIYYLGSPINAMYSSTCGGRTEDFSNVFGGRPVPYLTSVFCTVESGSATAVDLKLKGEHELNQVVFAADGMMANRNLELAAVLDLVQSGALTPEFLTGSAEKSEIQAWVQKARVLANRTSDAETNTRDITTRAGFIQFAVESFFGSGELNRRISQNDVSYYLSNLKDGEQVPEAARPAMALVIQKGLWRPYPDNSARPLTPIRRCDALSMLAHWIEDSRPDLLRRGVLQSIEQGNILVKGSTKTQQLGLADDVRLFLVAEGRRTPVDSLRMIGSEKIRFHLHPGGKIDFLEVELSPAGASSDRFSPQSSWQSTIAGRVVSEKLRPLTGNIGEVSDLVPARLGNSGRAVEIQVVGTQGSVSLNGYRVRTALGLKDTLFTLSRTSNGDGSIEAFTFTGRGWGHGIGLCQVGAFGMARAGRSYEEILKTYYRGVELRKAY